AVARVADHRSITPERVDETPLPAIPLPAQLPHTSRYLGPTDRIGDELEPVAAALVARLAVEVHTQLEVLTDPGPREPTDLDDRRAAEYAERAGDDQQAVDRAPTGSGGEKRPEVLDGLKHRQPIARESHLYDVTLVDAAAVGDADDPARADGR